jgi:succinyl-CoA synthetase alpha subunit
MSNELYSVCARAADGVAEGVAIGGDAFPGSTLSDHCRRYQRMPAVKLIVVLGEIGGEDEYSLVAAMESKEITKPVVRGRGREGRRGRSMCISISIRISICTAICVCVSALAAPPPRRSAASNLQLST